MIVRWLEQRLLVIPIFTNEKNPKDLQTTTVPQVVLFPGFNDIPDDVWKQARVRVPEHLENENLKELANVRKGKEGKDDVIIAVKLSDLDPKKATKIAAETINPETLKKWEAEEVRDGVLKVIRDQIVKIKTKSPTNNLAMKNYSTTGERAPDIMVNGKEEQE